MKPNHGHRRDQSLSTPEANGSTGDTPPIPLNAQLTGVHGVIILPEWAADIGRHYDATKLIQTLAAAPTQVVEFCVKPALGYALFPLSDRPCPKDWATETRQLAAKAGQRFIAYYNIGLDNWMAEQQPDWISCDADGKPWLFDDTFSWLCVRSPWRDRILAEVEEMVEGLQPDGVFLDIAGMPNAYGPGHMDPARACHCSHCQAAFRAQHGRELPRQTDDAALREEVFRFGHDGRVAILHDVFALVRRLNPNLIIGSNGSGYYDGLIDTPESLNAFATYYSSEAKSPHYQSYKAKLMWSLDKPYQMHTYGSYQTMQPGNAIGTWVDWNLIPARYMEISAAMLSAHAGRLVIGTNLTPDGTLFDGQIEAMRPALAAVRDREPWLAGLQSVPNIALVYDSASEHVLRVKNQSDDLGIQTETRGLHDALFDGSFHFDIVDGANLKTTGHRAVIIGDAMCADESQVPALRDFVTDGGLLVVTHETSLRDQQGGERTDFAWAELLGVRYEGRSPIKQANYGLLGDELRGPLLNYPILLTAEALHVSCTTAKPLAELVHPEAERTDEAFLWQTTYNHFKYFTGKPLITLNRIGQGAVVYIAAPLGRQIAERNDPNLKAVLTRIIRLYTSDLAITIKAPAGIAVVFGQREEGPLGQAIRSISLINTYASMVLNSPDDVIPLVGPVSLRVPLRTLPQPPQSVESIDAHGLTWKVTDDELQIEIAQISLHAVIAIK